MSRSVEMSDSPAVGQSVRMRADYIDASSRFRLWNAGAGASACGTADSATCASALSAQRTEGPVTDTSTGVRNFERQYAQFYAVRLMQLRPRALLAARRAWGSH